MNTIAIIPARGGSKRFKGKNLALLNSIPLLVHSIQFAKKNSKIIDGIYVSTDSAEIAAVAKQYGASVIERPSQLSGDLEPTVTSLKHALTQLPDTIENVVLLQPTNPLRPENILQDGFKKYMEGNHDSLTTVSRNEQKFGKIIDGTFVPFNYTFGQRSQDLEPLYFENGLLYISKATLIKEDTITGRKNLPYIIDHPFALVDIDTDKDLAYAEFILKTYKK